MKYEKPKTGTDQRRLDELTDVLVDLIEESEGAIEGVLILIDEADRPSSNAHLGQLCKLLTERLARRRCERVCVGLAGLPALLSNLKESHESSLRIFNVLTLEPLEPSERAHVIEKGLKEANEKSGFEISISNEAKNMIGHLSEG